MLGDIPRKFGEGLAKIWKGLDFKGYYKSITDSLGNVMGSVTSWASSSFKSVKDWFTGNSPSVAPPGTTTSPSTTATPAAINNMPAGVTVRNGALLVGLAQNDGNWISYSTAGQTQLRDMMTQALRSAQGGPTPAARTSPSVSGLFDPVTKKGRAFGETEFQEVGKYDPVVYALGKLTKIQAEHVELSREVAVAMKLNVRQSTESGRYLRSMNRAFQ
jgi:hypothetical protein